MKNLYASFGRYSSYQLDNKANNYHNCRKSALLSQMLIKNKLLMIIGTAANHTEGIQHLIARNTDTYKSQVLLFADRYIELASMVFDL